MLLSIVGNEYCEGVYLEAALNYSLQHHHSTTLLIADEVYWHNLKPRSTKKPLSQDRIDQFKQEALALGTQYFERNLQHFLAPLHISAQNFNQEHGTKSTSEKIAIINQLAHHAGLNFKILGWQDWINTHPDFKKTKLLLCNSIQQFKN